MGTTPFGPRRGPFDAALVPESYVQQRPSAPFSGYEGTGGTIAGLASKFLEGMSQGRLAAYAQKENKKNQALQAVGSFVESRLNDSRYTDEYKQQLTGKFHGMLAKFALEGMKPEKGEPKTGRAATGAAGSPMGSDVGTVLKHGMRTVLEGLTGGPMKGSAINPDDLLEMMKVESSAYQNENNLVQPQIQKAAGLVHGAVEQFTQRAGRAPFADEVRQFPEWNQAVLTLRRVSPSHAETAIKELEGRFQPGPKPGSTEAETVAAEDALRESQRTTPAPPGTAAAPSASGAATQPTPAPPGAVSGDPRFSRGAPMFMAPGPAEGLVTPGTIDLVRLPAVQREDGRWSTVDSASREVDGKEILYPTIVGGQKVSDKEAFDHAMSTGQNLGVFEDAASADAYAKRLHGDWEAGKIPGVAMPGAAASMAPTPAPPAPRDVVLTPQQVSVLDVRKKIEKPTTLYRKDGSEVQAVFINGGTAGVPGGHYTPMPDGTYKRLVGDFSATKPDLKGTIEQDSKGFLQHVVNGKATPVRDAAGNPVKGKMQGTSIVRTADHKFALVHPDTGIANYLKDADGKVITAPSPVQRVQDRQVAMSKALIATEKTFEARRASLDAEHARSYAAIDRQTTSQVPGMPPALTPAQATAKKAEIEKDIAQRKARADSEEKRTLRDLRRVYLGTKPDDDDDDDAEPDIAKPWSAADAARLP